MLFRRAMEGKREQAAAEDGAGAAAQAGEAVDLKALRRGVADWYARKTRRAEAKAERALDDAQRRYEKTNEARIGTLMRNCEEFARAREALVEAQRVAAEHPTCDESGGAYARLQECEAAYDEAYGEALRACLRNERTRDEFSRAHVEARRAFYELCRAEGAVSHAKREASYARAKARRGFDSALNHAKAGHAGG